MNKRLIINVGLVVTAILLCGGIVYAASHDITSTLGGSSGDFFNLDGTLSVGSVKVGAQGVGGVTFFNGTIINETTTDDVDNPVTFGDNVRIDGRIYRGTTAGTGDSLPVIVNDNMEVAGTLTVAGLSGVGVVDTSNLADGTIATVDLATDSVTTTKIVNETIITQDIADEAVTQALEDATALGDPTQTTTANPDDYDLLTTEVDITTGDSNLLCLFSGVFANNNDIGTARIFLVLDDEIYTHTIRRGTSSSGDETFTLAFTALVDVAAGDHTVQIGWNTATAGSQVALYNHTLDVVELKK